MKKIFDEYYERLMLLLILANFILAVILLFQ